MLCAFLYDKKFKITIYDPPYARNTVEGTYLHASDELRHHEPQGLFGHYLYYRRLYILLTLSSEFRICLFVVQHYFVLIYATTLQSFRVSIQVHSTAAESTTCIAANPEVFYWRWYYHYYEFFLLRGRPTGTKHTEAGTAQLACESF